ncbi:alkaline phosphatase family protein [Alishewanella longhuensis]
MREALAAVDAEIAYLVNTLRTRGQFEQVNLIISSDHGMAEVDQRKYMIADELFDSSLARSVRFSREILSIFPKEGEEEKIYQQITERYNPEHMRLYREAKLPARFYHQQHARMRPL